MSEPRVFAAAGHRCAATVSSMGGERTYPWASAPSTWEKMACVLGAIGAQTTFSPAARVRRGRRGPMPSSQLSVWT